MSFGPLTGLRVQHSTTLDEASLASLLLLQTHLVFLLYPTLLITTTVLEDTLHSYLLLL